MKKQKIILFDSDNLLKNKLYNILKRNFSVIELQCGKSSKENRNIELYYPKKIVALAEIESANYIIINSEVILDYIIEYKAFDIINWIKGIKDECIKNRIHFAYIYIRKPFEFLLNILDERLFCKYEEVNHTVIRFLLESLNNNLLFQIDAVYGSGDLLDEYIESTQQNEHAVLNKFMNKYGIVPVLADKVAIYIADHMEDFGQHNIHEKNLLFGINVKKHQKKCSFNLIYQLEAEDYYFGKNIAEQRISLGKTLAKSIPHQIRERIDIVCPVPRTGMYYAMGVSQELRKPYVEALLKPKSRERSFQIANVDERKMFLWSKIKPIPELLKNKSVAIVDEAIFTGTTLKVICEMLWECKVKEIFLLIPTPKCRYHCDYLVHPSRPMLLEYIKDNMLEEYFNIGGIFFQDDANFENALNEFDSDICAECFWGRKD